MKITIQGHPTRGNEVIQILESLGGKNLSNHNGKDNYAYYISNVDNRIYRTSLLFSAFKHYTLEEFEKEFPFKVGDLCVYSSDIRNVEIIVKILGMAIKDDCIMYEVGHKDIIKAHSYIYRKRDTLRPYKEMKEERNITLTLEKAKEWYKKGGDLKQVALQVFTEKELNQFPRSWEEFCKQGNPIASWRYTIPTKYEALYKLEQLRDCWIQGWKPTSEKAAYAIKVCSGKLDVFYYFTREFLSFPTREMAEEFLECFKDLIELAKDLI